LYNTYIESNNNGSENPLVSVIIPTYNRSHMLLRAVQSVLRQTYRSLECIVVDDGSSDNSIEKIRRQFQDKRLIFLRHDMNKNASSARNTGIAYSKGQFLAFLDDDDEWLPEKLQKQLSLIQKLPLNVGMVYCWMDCYDKDDRIDMKHHSFYTGYVFPHVLDEQRIGGCPTLLIRRSVIDKVGGFDESIGRGDDGDFIRRICLRYEVDCIAEVLVKVYTDHGHSRLTRNDKTGVKEAILSYNDRLVKFKSELHKYPKQTANIYASVAYYYGEAGDRKNSMTFFQKAFRKYPFCFNIYRYGLRRLGKAILKR